MTIINPPAGSTFEMLFPGAGERGAPLLDVLGIRSGGTYRYRTAWIEDDGDAVLALYTRLGNEVEHADQVSTLRTHPMWMSDDPSTFDSTYRCFRFLLPVEPAEGLRTWLSMHVGDEPKCHCGAPQPEVFDHRRDFDEEWAPAMDRLIDHPTEQQEQWKNQMMDQLRVAFGD